MTENKDPHPFIVYLYSLKDNRGAMAALRRGLGQPPGAVPEMFPYVVPWLPGFSKSFSDAAHYLIASLYAYHPLEISMGNMGAHLRATIKDENSEKATERRFVTLLNCHRDDLGLHLRHAVSYLKSKDQPICWDQLFHDLWYWDHPDHFVQRDWANGFWGRSAQKLESTENVAEKPAATN